MRDHRHALLAEEGFVVYLDSARRAGRTLRIITKKKTNDEEMMKTKMRMREIPNESTPLLRGIGLKLAKMTRSRQLVAVESVFVHFIHVVAMICIYVGYAEDVYDSEKVLSTEAKEAAGGAVRERSFCSSGKKMEG